MYIILSTGSDDTEIIVNWYGETDEQEARIELQKLAGDIEIKDRSDNDSETLVCKFGGYNIVMSYRTVQLHKLPPK